MNNNNLDFWMDVLGGFALGFLSGVLVSEDEDLKSKGKQTNVEVEDLGYAVIIEDDDNIQ
jgi:hypothetical protein